MAIKENYVKLETVPASWLNTVAGEINDLQEESLTHDIDMGTNNLLNAGNITLSGGSPRTIDIKNGDSATNFDVGFSEVSTANVKMRVFPSVNTSGQREFQVLSGDGNNNTVFSVRPDLNRVTVVAGNDTVLGSNGDKLDLSNANDNAYISYDETTDSSNANTLAMKGFNGFSFHTDTNTDIVNFTQGGNVGIGTSSPSTDRKLEVVRNNATANPTVTIKEDSGGDVGVELAVTAQSYTFGIDNNDSDKFLFNLGSIISGGSNIVTFDTNRRVGINETNPGVTFQVNGGNDNTVAAFESTDTGANIELFDNSTVTKPKLQAVGDDLMLRVGNSNSFYVESGAPDDSIRIDSVGRVGIGTGSPDRKFVVAEDTDTTTYFQITNSGAGLTGTNGMEFIQNGTGNNLKFNFLLRENADMGFWTNGTERLTIDNVGTLKKINANEDLEIVDAGSTGATEQDWIEVKVGGVTGYIRVFASQ